MYPTDRKYTKTHEWVKIEGNILTIGLTDYAVKELQGINHVYVNERISGIFYGPGLELQPVTEEDLQNKTVKRSIQYLPGRVVTEVDPKEKDAIYIYSPVKGRVIEFNDRANESIIMEESEEFYLLIEKDPYGEGWIAKIEILDPASLIPLMSAQEFQKFLEEEEEY